MRKKWKNVSCLLYCFVICTLIPLGNTYAASFFHRLGPECLNDICLMAPSGSETPRPGDFEAEMECTCRYFEGYDRTERNCLFEESCLPLMERVRDLKLAVHPNPVWEDYSIQIKGKEVPSQLQYKVLEVNGVVVHEEGEIENGRINLSSRELPPGNYLVHIIMDGTVIKRHFFGKIR